MNPNLSTAECVALLELLERGMVHIRLSAGEGDAIQAEAIADALHNAPPLLREGQRWGWTVRQFRELFLAPLVERYTDLHSIEQPLDVARRRLTAHQ